MRLIKLLLITTLWLALLTSCTETPQNYACAYIDQSKTILSLSIKPGSAILDRMEYTKMCVKEGNSVTYGLKQADCDGLAALKDYAILRFDSIIGRADAFISAGKVSVAESFKCTKVN